MDTISAITKACNFSYSHASLKLFLMHVKNCIFTSGCTKAWQQANTLTALLAPALKLEHFACCVLKRLHKLAQSAEHSPTADNTA